MILVIGKNGQLASSFRQLLPDATFWGHEELPEIEKMTLLKRLQVLRPSLIVNAAAYTAVDKAESEKDKAFELNASLPEILGIYASKAGIPVVHFSTDYVFSGEGHKAWTENDRTGPISVYGQSKLEGEERLLNSGAQAFIFRTSWVYSFHGNNFVKTILRLAGEREVLKIVADQVGAPTYAPDLAQAIVQNFSRFVEKGSSLQGVYHLTGEGFVSWYEFAQSIVAEARKLNWPLKVQEILPLTTKEYPTPAQRPLNSRLAQGKVRKDLGIYLPSYQDSLKQAVVRLFATI